MQKLGNGWRAQEIPPVPHSVAAPATLNRLFLKLNRFLCNDTLIILCPHPPAGGGQQCTEFASSLPPVGVFLKLNRFLWNDTLILCPHLLVVGSNERSSPIHCHQYVWFLCNNTLILCPHLLVVGNSAVKGVRHFIATSKLGVGVYALSR